MKKVILFFIFFAISFSLFSVRAEEIDLKDYFVESYDFSISIPDETKEILDSLEIDYLDQNSFSKLSFKEVFNQFTDIFKQNKNGGLFNGIFIISIILISSCVSGISNQKLLGNNQNIVEYITAIVIISSIIYNLLLFLNLIENTIESCGSIMLTFFPILGGILLSMGKVATSGVVCSTLLLLPEIITQVIVLVLLPLVKITFAISICSSVAPNLKVTKIIEIFRKTTTWILTFIISIFMFVFSTQTVISISADNVTTKTAKFVVGSSVPIVGSAVSEAVSTVSSCMSVLKNTISAYAIFAVVALFLPIILELIIWKFSLMFSGAVSDLMGNENITILLDNVNKILSFFFAVIISVLLMFIVSVTLLTLGVSS